MAFKVMSERPGQGAVGAGELNPADATHKFIATDDDGNELYAGVADDQDHALLRAWSRAAHKAEVKIKAISKASAAPEGPAPKEPAPAKEAKA